MQGDENSTEMLSRWASGMGRPGSPVHWVCTVLPENFNDRQYCSGGVK